MRWTHARDTAIFFVFFSGFGLTKCVFGCILYDIGSAKCRCSPQNWRRSDGIPGVVGRWAEEIFWKIFGKAFDKAQKCAIVYITRLISELIWSEARSDHWESPGMDGERALRECSSQRCPGKPGNFWKEHWQTRNRCYIKCAVLLERPFARLFWWAGIEPEDSTEEFGCYHPDTR